MPTKAQIISDVELQLQQAAPSQSSELEWDQIAYWVSVHLNQVIATEINSKLAKGEMIPAVYIRKAVCELLEEENAIGTDRVYAELEEDVLTLNNDAGIIKVESEEGDEIQKVSTENLSLFKKMRFSKPGSQNLQYLHEGGRQLYFPGFKPVDIAFEGITAWFVPQQDILSADDTDEILVSDLALPTVIDLAVERGKRELYGTQSDEENDGQDVKKIQYHTAIRNPNTDQQQ
jgi:hypothetical protein